MNKTKTQEAREMFDNLKKHIGEIVICNSWRYGLPDTYIGRLNSVNDFESIVIDNKIFVLIGYGCAVKSIQLEKTQEYLYNNKYIEDNYDKRREREVSMAREEMFGNIADRNQSKKTTFQENLDARKNRYFYMNAGLPLIKEELQEEWLEYVDEFIYDKIDSNIIEISLTCLRKLKNGASCESIGKTFSELNVETEITNRVISILKRFSTRAEEFEEYWNQLYPDSRIKTSNNFYKHI